MSRTPADFWRANADLRDITPRGERFPEVGLFDALQTYCIGSVFEFGCGDGRLSSAFDSHAYYGHDINEHALNAARRANPFHRYGSKWVAADTFLAHTVLLHVPDAELSAIMDKALQYRRIVIGEVMGRRWRRPGDPPVFNREPEEYEAATGRRAEIARIPYPRYSCDLQMMVMDA